MTPPWESKYTVNINTEMNYWPAEVTNRITGKVRYGDRMVALQSKRGAIKRFRTPELL